MVGTPTPDVSAVKVNTNPPVGAAVGNVIVPVADVPPISSYGAIERANLPGASIVRVLVTVPPLSEAEIFTLVAVVIADVLTTNVPKLTPA